MIKRLSAMVLVLIALGILTGCGGTTVKDKSGNKVTINKNKKKLTFKGENGKGTAEFGQDLKLPEGFPKDFPLYKGAKIQMSLTTSEGKKIVNYQVKAPMSSVTDFYKRKLNDAGYRITGTFSAKNITTFSAENDKYKVAMSITATKEGTTVSIDVGTEKPKP